MNNNIEKENMNDIRSENENLYNNLIKKLNDSDVDNIGKINFTINFGISLLLIIIYLFLISFYWFKLTDIKDKIFYTLLTTTALTAIASAIYFVRNSRANFDIKKLELEVQKNKIQSDLLIKSLEYDNKNKELEIKEKELNSKDKLLQKEIELKNKFYFSKLQDLINTNLNNRKLDRSYFLSFQWTEITSKHINKKTLTFINEIEELDSKKRIIRINEEFLNDSSLEQSILSIFNFLESLSIEYFDDNRLDKQQLLAFYSNIIKRYYSLFSPWIAQIRQEANRNGEDGNKYFRFIENLYNLL